MNRGFKEAVNIGWQKVEADNQARKKSSMLVPGSYSKARDLCGGTNTEMHPTWNI